MDPSDAVTSLVMRSGSLPKRPVFRHRPRGPVDPPLPNA